MTPPPPQFDVEAYYDRLTAEERRAIGLAAVTFVVGSAGYMLLIKPRHGTIHPGTDGWFAAREAGRDALNNAVLVARDGQPILTALHRPALAAIGVRSCRICGCTELHACPGGCHWVAADLCSACAPAAPDAA